MAKHRSHSVAFKRQVAQEFIGGETLSPKAQHRSACPPPKGALQISAQSEPS
jgi:hypothetical protein